VSRKQREKETSASSGEGRQKLRRKAGWYKKTKGRKPQSKEKRREKEGMFTGKVNLQKKAKRAKPLARKRKKGPKKWGRKEATVPFRGQQKGKGKRYFKKCSKKGVETKKKEWYGSPRQTKGNCP